MPSVALLTDPDVPLTNLSDAWATLGFAGPVQLCEPEQFAATVEVLTERGHAGAFLSGRLRVDAARASQRFFTATDALGVANVMKFGSQTFATNTEGSGFAASIETLEPGAALILGAGTGARMACYQLLKAGWKVKVWNRSIARTRSLAVACQAVGTIQPIHEADPNRCRLIINATTLGARASDKLPVLWDRSSPGTVAFDFVHRDSAATEFLRAASIRGFSTIDASAYLGHVVSQAARWLNGTGPTPDEVANLLRRR